jgi:hypothetical protein
MFYQQAIRYLKGYDNCDDDDDIDDDNDDDDDDDNSDIDGYDRDNCYEDD